MNAKELQEKLKDRNIKEVSRQTGIKYHVIYKIATGDVTNPKLDVYLKLVEYLSK